MATELKARRSARKRRPSIEIGDTVIAPGERRTIDLPLAALSTHTEMTMPVQVIHGRQDGPRLFVCGALHGDEINGVEIIRRLLNLSALKRLRGTLIAVPIVNVLGFVSQSRYLPDRRDLNRSFPGSTRGSLAGRLARLFLDEIVSKSTHGIDLHTGALHRDNFPQIRGNLEDPETDRMARAFGVPAIINTGFREGSLREAAQKRHVPVIVYEAGEALRFNESCIRAGVTGVTNVMRALGMLADRRRASAPQHQIVIGSSTWVRAPQSGLVRTEVALGKQVSRGETLAVVADPFGENEETIVSPDDGLVIGRTNLPVAHEGDALFHVARYTGKQAVARLLDAFEPETNYQEGLTSELAGEPEIV